MNDLKMKRLGIIMEPQDGNLHEVEGVLNPAAVRGPDGQLYLFPRLIAKGNYSRIGIARVIFNEAGDPTGVERLGLALEPEADYERHAAGGGCEDPRITYLEPAQHYEMTYTAFSASGPRIAVAISNDLFHWERLGLAKFAPFNGMDFGDIDDKDASFFPVQIPNPSEKPMLAMLHRPLFPGTRAEEEVNERGPRELDINHESIWISYANLETSQDGPHRLHWFKSHHRLATPVQPWERLKIGGGTPPILTRHGWLVIYHGVGESPGSTGEHPALCYSAGVMLLSRKHPQVILYRSATPALTPELPEERRGVIANVVFPTGIDRRDDIGAPDRFDVYYGMADDKIGVARLDLPETMPQGGAADPEQGVV